MVDSPEIKCNSTQLGLHPLEPLSVEEVKTVVAIVQTLATWVPSLAFPQPS
jgi:Cu2+-containing amine oxidase